MKPNGIDKEAMNYQIKISNSLITIITHDYKQSELKNKVISFE